MPVQSTMMEHPLTLTQLLRHGARLHAGSQVVIWDGAGGLARTFGETYGRISQLAGALRDVGVRSGEVVATFCWNTQPHVEAYFAVPCMGAVLHTLNVRLHPDQIAYAVRDSGARVVIVDGSLLERLVPVLSEVSAIEHVIVVGPGDADDLPQRWHDYEELLAAADPEFSWPEVDERAPAMVCHTSGTTGNPKGVVYSHRSQWTHTFGAILNGLRLDETSRLLQVVPQFHANGWGFVYACWVIGADLLLPGESLEPADLARFIAVARPTHAAAVPTVWAALLAHVQQHPTDLSSLREIVIGGSAVPRTLIERYHDQHGIRILQAWGMTETSPLAALARPPRTATTWSEEVEWRSRTGRVLPGVDARIAVGGLEQPWDDASVGELQVRGPWITGSYLGGVGAEQFTEDGWLRTGDIATMDPTGSIRIVDRAKDVIKSGGEWISSVDLEAVLAGHPDIVEACVIGVADERWDERPLAAVVLRAGVELDVAAMTAWLEGRVARWWIPERWVAIGEVPKTSVGKFDKKLLRAHYEQGMLYVSEPG